LALLATMLCCLEKLLGAKGDTPLDVPAYFHFHFNLD